MAEKLQWLADHWSEIGFVVSAVAFALVGKWALVRSELAKLLVKNGEGEINRSFRSKVGRAMVTAAPLVRETLANMAAETDPDPNKKPQSKGKRFFKFLGRALLGRIIPG